MSIEKIVVSMLLLSGLMVGIGIFYNAMGDEYSSLAPNAQTKNFTALDYTDDLYDSLADAQKEIDGMTAESSSDVANVFNIINFFTLGGAAAIKTFMALPVITTAFIGDFTRMLELPFWVSPMIIGLILITLIFGMIYAVLKVKP